jgi:hypothetical protein
VHRPYKWDDHVLKPYATALATAGPALAARLTPELLATVIALVPDEWLDDPEPDRSAYLAHLTARAAQPEAWLP